MESESNGHNPDFNEFKDSKGRFTNGNPGKPKGAMVTSTLKIKKAVVDFLELNMDKVQESFDQLKPLEKLQFITAIMPYAVPKMQAIQSEISQETNHSGRVVIEIIRPGSMESNTRIQPVSGVQQG